MALALGLAMPPPFSARGVVALVKSTVARTYRRRALQVAVVAIWMFAVGWQVRREYFKPELTRPAESAMALAPGVSFYTLEMGGRAIGVAWRWTSLIGAPIALLMRVGEVVPLPSFLPKAQLSRRQRCH